MGIIALDMSRVKAYDRSRRNKGKEVNTPAN
jgi:hypothetical protein